MNRGRNFRFESPDDLSDVNLVVFDGTLYVNKGLLMIHSPVFRDMLEGKEELHEILLPHKKYSLMVEMLRQIYPEDGVDFIKDETLKDLLALADEFQVQQVFTNCRLYIAKRIDSNIIKLNTDDILFYLTLVDKYTKLSSLRSALVEHGSRICIHEVEKSTRYSYVPHSALKDVFHKRLRMLEDDPVIKNRLKDLNTSECKQACNTSSKWSY